MQLYAVEVQKKEEKKKKCLDVRLKGEVGSESGVGYQGRDEGSCSMHIGTLWT